MLLDIYVGGFPCDYDSRKQSHYTVENIHGASAKPIRSDYDGKGIALFMAKHCGDAMFFQQRAGIKWVVFVFLLVTLGAMGLIDSVMAGIFGVTAREVMFVPIGMGLPFWACWLLILLPLMMATLPWLGRKVFKRILIYDDGEDAQVLTDYEQAVNIFLGPVNVKTNVFLPTRTWKRLTDEMVDILTYGNLEWYRCATKQQRKELCRIWQKVYSDGSVRFDKDGGLERLAEKGRSVGADSMTAAFISGVPINDVLI